MIGVHYLLSKKSSRYILHTAHILLLHCSVLTHMPSTDWEREVESGTRSYCSWWASPSQNCQRAQRGQSQKYLIASHTMAITLNNSYWCWLRHKKTRKQRKIKIEKINKMKKIIKVPTVSRTPADSNMKQNSKTEDALQRFSKQKVRNSKTAGKPIMLS